MLKEKKKKESKKEREGGRTPAVAGNKDYNFKGRVCRGCYAGLHIYRIMYVHILRNYRH
jgi:hypothetical protein